MFATVPFLFIFFVLEKNANIDFWSELCSFFCVDKTANVNFFDSHDNMFSGFRKTLDMQMWELTNEGDRGGGVSKNSLIPLPRTTRKHSGKSACSLWTPQKNYWMFFFLYNGKVFGLRGGEEHIELLAERFELGHDDINNHDTLNLCHICKETFNVVWSLIRKFLISVNQLFIMSRRINVK